MYYGEIKNYDIANGTGVRVSLFVSGCRNHCKGCFQPQTWDFNFGKPFTSDTEETIINMLRAEYISGLTILGGEPMEPENQCVLLPFLKRVKEEYPYKTIWMFSGYTLEEMYSCAHPRCEATDDLLNLVDVIVDGRFNENLKDISLRFRGSLNQRIIDMNNTRINGNITLWNGF